MYVRMCQECGYLQEARRPTQCNDIKWAELKCKKCKSPVLDYGHDGYKRDADGAIVRDLGEDA